LKTSICLRIASAIAFLFATGHTMGAPWTPATGESETALVESMKSLRFTVMGTDRTYWDFYFGFGVSITVYQLALAVILWQTASLAKSDAVRARPIMFTMLAAYLGIGVLGWMYFFAAPLVMAVAICVCIVVALAPVGPQDTQGKT
jgi:hypothetical protein